MPSPSHASIGCLLTLHLMIRLKVGGYPSSATTALMMHHSDSFRNHLLDQEKLQLTGPHRSYQARSSFLTTALPFFPFPFPLLFLIFGYSSLIPSSSTSTAFPTPALKFANLPFSRILV